jgi:ABC-2 type transport system ATP-binding protein
MELRDETPTYHAAAVRFEQLSKTYGHGAKGVQAVKNLSLEIAAGQVYGILGPNGAGKTTTIRMMLGLIRPTAGDVYIFDRNVRQERDVLRRVGAMVEDSRFYNFLSGRANLEVLARTGNVYNPKRITMLLEQIGLDDRAGRDVKGYSTGMKQRLGLAAALLGDPDLVLLDEPTNGLDPAGIQEMRGFVRDLAQQQGKTVFLSSHLLSEVEQVCDRVAIINRGTLVREGAVADLLAARSSLRVEASPVELADQALREHWQVSREGDSLLISAARDDAPHLVRLLVEHNIDVYHVAVERQSLEEYFMNVTQMEATHAA